MKYTKEYVANNKIAVECMNLEEKKQFINMLGEVIPALHFGGIKCKDITIKDLQNDKYIDYKISRVGRFSLEDDMSVCHEILSGSWYKKEGYEIITFQEFINCNNFSYELY